MTKSKQIAILAAAVTLALATLLVLLTHHTTTPQNRPTATAFRAYLANPASRMVAYSPPPEIADDPQQRVLREQLTRLREKFDGLSLYECTPQTRAIVDTARSLGYKAVLVTVWDPRSESELANAADIARTQSGALAVAVSLGSEGLMQQRYSLGDLATAQAKLLARETAVETTTTEAWWLYQKPEYKTLNTFGDFTSINVHVVWDTDIADPALAARWTRDRAGEIAKTTGRPLLIREAGLPGGGASPRQNARIDFTRQLQAEFWHAWLKLDAPPPLVAFEAFDNPDKSWREFEQHWGLLTPTPAGVARLGRLPEARQGFFQALNHAQDFVISTEATNSSIVRCAAERPPYWRCMFRLCTGR